MYWYRLQQLCYSLVPEYTSQKVVSHFMLQITTDTYSYATSGTNVITTVPRFSDKSQPE